DVADQLQERIAESFDCKKSENTGCRPLICAVTSDEAKPLTHIKVELMASRSRIWQKLWIVYSPKRECRLKPASLSTQARTSAPTLGSWRAVFHTYMRLSPHPIRLNV